MAYLQRFRAVILGHSGSSLFILTIHSELCDALRPSKDLLMATKVFQGRRLGLLSLIATAGALTLSILCIAMEDCPVFAVSMSRFSENITCIFDREGQLQSGPCE